MTTQVILTLPDELYSRARRIAHVHHQDVTTLLVEALTESPILDEAAYEHGDDEDEAVDQEMAAYLAMHPTLWKQYPGQYVAVYEGKLVDHDTDPIALSQRINEKYPDVFVWMSKVEAQPFRTLHMPSFRLVK